MTNRLFFNRAIISLYYDHHYDNIFFIVIVIIILFKFYVNEYYILNIKFIHAYT